MVGEVQCPPDIVVAYVECHMSKDKVQTIFEVVNVQENQKHAKKKKYLTGWTHTMPKKKYVKKVLFK